MAVVVLLAGALGCSGTVLRDDTSGGCVVDGKRHKSGERFPAADGCNTCSCGDDGNVQCTAMGCVATCTYQGKTYPLGDSFPAGDGCNTCSCDEAGGVACTKMACVTGCTWNGETHQQGETFPAGDGCNTCECLETGDVGCTLMACPVECTWQGETYQPNESFPAGDGCNTCVCETDGYVACTELACACDPNTEWYRRYFEADPESCALIDYDCPPNTFPFSNTCGCGCEQDSSCPEWFDCMPPNPCDPQKIQLECPYSGIAY
jgi:hypothetical protein